MRQLNRFVNIRLALGFSLVANLNFCLERYVVDREFAGIADGRQSQVCVEDLTVGTDANLLGPATTTLDLDSTSTDTMKVLPVCNGPSFATRAN